MKKILIAIICLVGLFALTACSVDTGVKIEKIKYVSYEIIDNNQVKIVYEVTAKNNSNKEAQFKILADFVRENGTGLLVDTKYYGSDESADIVLYHLDGKETRVLTCDFYGEYGGTDVAPGEVIPNMTIE